MKNSTFALNRIANRFAPTATPKTFVTNKGLLRFGGVLLVCVWIALSLPGVPLRTAMATTPSAMPGSAVGKPRAATANMTALGSVKYDFDGDGKADISRWHPANHTFEFKRSIDGEKVAVSVGNSSSIPAPGDFDGDGITDVAVFTAGTWTIKYSTTGVWHNITCGTVAGDIPMAGDYDGDGTTDAAIFRPMTATWIIAGSSESFPPIQFGQSGDIPIPGNYAGGTATDVAYFRPSTGDWHFWNVSNGQTAAPMDPIHWGAAGHIPLQGDFDGDGISDLVVYDPSNGAWYVNPSRDGFPGSREYVIWGSYNDQPAPGDYNGDGKTDYCVWRPTTGVWHMNFGHLGDLDEAGDIYDAPSELVKANYEYQTLGVPGDKAVPSAYTKQIGGTVTGYEMATARLAPRNATGGTNLYSQNFSWGTSLVNLPGRSGLDAGIGISYNSLVWIKSGSTIYFDPDASNVSPGFRFGFPVIEPVYYDSEKGIWAYIMVTPDGSRKEFRQLGASNYFETADSSYTQLKILGTDSPNSPVEHITMTVTTTDGTQMSYVWDTGAYRCIQIKDRNGNYITNTYSNGLLQTVTDTLRRVVTVHYDADNYPTTITQQWNTGTHTWATLSYTNATAHPNFISDSNLTVIGPPDGTVVKVLDKITYADSSATQFHYNDYVQVWSIDSIAPDSSSHILNNVSVNFETFSSAQADCPRFGQTSNSAENTTTVVTHNQITANQTFSLSGHTLSGKTKIQVWTDQHPDHLRSNTFVEPSGWAEDCRSPPKIV
jgi:hypothetical protein